MPDALRGAGIDIRVHDNLFPQGTEDVVWLREAGTHRWVVLTRDDRIRYNQLEKEAVLAARLRFFSITSSSLTGDEAARSDLVRRQGNLAALPPALKARVYREDLARPRREDHRNGDAEVTPAGKPPWSARNPKDRKMEVAGHNG